MIITTAIIKGGTGKSSTAAALAQAAVMEKKKVLAIDLDPQANLTFFLGADQNRPGCYELLHGAPVRDLIQETEQGVFVISGSPNLAAEKTAPASAKRLQEAIAPIKNDFDLVICDTPPMMGELTFNGLQACTGLLIPLETDSASLQGLYQIADIAHQMQRSNPELEILGVVLTRYDGRAKLNRYLRETIEEKAEEAGVPFLTAIRSGVSIREAQALQVNLFEYSPRSNPAQDYKALYKMITEGSK